jgi:hypothetical protein
MVASVNNSNLTGLPPVFASEDDREQLYQFRSIERTGYLSVTDLVRDFLFDAASEAALSIVNVAITETHLSNQTAKNTNPENFIQYGNIQHDASGSLNPFFLSQRLRTLTNAGAGYAVGDELVHYVPGAKANVIIRVDSIDTSSGVNSIKTFSILHSGDYDTAINPLASDKKLVFRTRLNPKAALVAQKDYSYTQDTASNKFFFQSKHTGNGYVGGLPGPTVVPSFNGIIMVQGAGAFTNHWENSFGSGATVKGRGGPADPESITVYTITAALTATITPPSTRWPVDGIWANIKVANNDQIVPGCEIMLVPGQANSLSSIPPGTLVTQVDEIEVVDGTTTASGGVGVTNYYETTNKYIYITTSNSITINKGDAFVVKGNGAAFSDLTTDNNTADVFTVITEATDRIDPLADNNVPVTANVLAISGGNVRLGSISHSRGWAPTVYEGASIEHSTNPSSFPTNGATVANVANITYSTTVGATVANITTDVPLSVSLVGQTIKFTLATRQPWRLAFMANGKQTLNVSAGTSIQMTDDANKPIARIADYTGSITDITGLLGDVPSTPTLSSVAGQFVTGVGFTIGGTVAGTTVAIGGVNYPKTGTNVMEITAMGATDNVYPGYCLDLSSVPSAATFKSVAVENIVIISQILPLTGTERINGPGRYYVTKDFVNATTYAATNTKWAKVLDRTVNPADITQGFVNRSVRVNQYPEAFPMSYFASFAKQGMFFGVWEGSWAVMQKSRSRQVSEKDAWFNWFIIQRPVHRKTGAVRTGGQSPVFCINSVGYKYWKFIVRERDVWHPTQGDAETTAIYFDDITNTVSTKRTAYRVPADAHTNDSHAVLNTTHQIALTEDSKYLVSFLYNLTTPRFRYSDELDLVGQTAADVSMASSDVKLTAYGESKQRVYKSLGANLPYNAGLRISVLKDIYTA